MMDNRISIAEVITDNYEKIKNNTYSWEKEELDVFYRLIESRLNRFHIIEDLREDLRGSIILKIFSDVINKLDINRSDAISTYLVISIDNEIRNYIKRFIKHKREISFDAFVDGDEFTRAIVPSLEDIEDTKIDLKCSREYTQYLIELEEITKKFDCVKLSYIDNIKHQDIAIDYNVSRSNISSRVNCQLEAIKMVLMTRGYTSDFFVKYCGYNGFSDEYKYCESLIEKYGLFYLIYNMNTNQNDIKDALKVERRSIGYALNYLKDMKIDILNKKGIKDARAYVGFTSYFLPELLYNIETQDESYFEFVDRIIEEDQYIRLRFQSGMNTEKIAKETQTSKQFVLNRFNLLKPIISRRYRAYCLKNKNIVNKK